MSRLRHDLKAYLRALRITTSETIIFFEGTENDPAFYHAIAERYGEETGRKVDLRRASELPNSAEPNQGGTGGKRTLLRAASALNRWRSSHPGILGSKEIAFCVDKDIDDIRGVVQSHGSLVYTRLHSTENHLVSCSDVHRAIAHAFSLTVDSVRSELAPKTELLNLSRHWKDWVVFSILAMHFPNCSSRGYGQPSPLNKPYHAAVTDSGLINRKFDELRAASNCSIHDFEMERNQTAQLVDHLLQSGRFDEVFKGKWYVDILHSLCECCEEWKSKCKHAGKKGLWIGIRATFALSELDYQHYKAAFTRAGFD